MRNNAFSTEKIGLILTTTLLLSACGGRSADPNFYTLAPQIAPVINSNVKLIQVMPVNVPARLNTQLMVLQKSDGQSYALDNQRWASNLSDELQSALSAGLQQKLGAIDVYNTGLTGRKVSYLIATEFAKFDIVQNIQTSQTEIEVMAAWVIKRKDPIDKPKLSQLNCRMSFTYPVTEQKQNFLKIAESYQAALEKVTTAIATSTLALDAQKMPLIATANCS